jgi:hypothetical protein
VSDDVQRYSGLKLLPAARKILESVNPGAALHVETVTRHGTTSDWDEDVITVDWGALSNPQRSSTDLRLVAIARSLLDGTPVDLSELSHFTHGSFATLMHALALVWPNPPRPIEEILGDSEMREITAADFLRGMGHEPPAGL